VAPIGGASPEAVHGFHELAHALVVFLLGDGDLGYLDFQVAVHAGGEFE
jgi:hypothetical protein